MKVRYVIQETQGEKLYIKEEDNEDYTENTYEAMSFESKHLAEVWCESNGIDYDYFRIIGLPS